MIEKIKDIILNVKEGNSYGFLTGNTGIVIFLYYCSRIKNDDKTKQFADNLLDEVFESQKKQGRLSFSAFDNGLAGIGWCLEYLIEHKFCEGNADYILEDVDTAVFKTINEQTQIPLNLQQGLIGYLLYITSRLKNKDAKKMSTQLNCGLLIKIINKLDEILPNQFQHIGKEIQFDLLWQFSVLFLVLDKTLELDIYNEKIEVMIEQWMFYLSTHLPGIHCHRLSLALSLYKINKKLGRPDIDKQIKVLLYSIDSDVLRKETDPYVSNLQHGWHGVVVLLYLAQQTFDADYPNYKMFGQLRQELLIRYKAKSEKAIDSILQMPKTGNSVGKGLVNGLTGIGMVYLLCPEVMVLD